MRRIANTKRRETSAQGSLDLTPHWFCNLDRPRFARSIKTSGRTTSHGRCSVAWEELQNWFRANAAPHDRYDYLYALDELDLLVDKIKKGSSKWKRPTL